jgi:hypothetical protein
MPFEKQNKLAGSRKGKPNRATADVRKAIALIAERNVQKLEEWISRVAVDDPDKAADIFLRMIEYYIPKLQRSELTGENGGPVKIEKIERTIVENTKAPDG